MKITLRSDDIGLYILKTTYRPPRNGDTSESLNLLLMDSEKRDVECRSVCVVNCIRVNRRRKHGLYFCSSAYIRPEADMTGITERAAIKWMCTLSQDLRFRIPEYAVTTQFHKRRVARESGIAHHALYRIKDNGKLRRVYADKLADTETLDRFCAHYRRR